MDTENMTVEIVSTISTVVKTERKAECGDLTLTAQVTTDNGELSRIEGINVMAEGVTLWSGYANPNISGSFYTSGREPEVMQFLIAVINNIKTNL